MRQKYHPLEMDITTIMTGSELQTESRNVAPEVVVSTTDIYHGKVVHLRVDTVQLADGAFSKREIVEHRGAVCIVPVTPQNEVIMVRQYRLAASQELLEIPAGTLEVGEKPDFCAARELEEETGLTASTLSPLFSAYLAPGYSTELIHAFLATGLETATGDAVPDDDEAIRVDRIPFTDLLDMIENGELKDSKSIAAILAAARRLQKTGVL